jgi:large subunit ribosomal protein L29
MKGKDLRERSNDELAVELKNLRDGLFRLRFRQVAESSTHGATEKRAIRKDIARVLTVMREREMAAKKE